MSQDATTDLSRVTLVAPQGRFDIALPAAVPLAYLLPALLGQAGAELADAGAEHGGWVVQRLGAEPFDTGKTVAALGIGDGDVLYLRPKAEALQPPSHDDTAEAITAVLAERSAAWTPKAGRVAGLCIAIAAAAAGIVALPLTGPPWHLAQAAAAVTGVLLMVAAGLASRAADDAVAGAVLGCAAAGYGGVAALLWFAHANQPWYSAGSAGTTTGCAVAVAVVAASGVVVGRGAPVFLAAALVGGLGTVAGLVAPHTSPAGGAAAALAGAYLIVPFAPMICYRLAGLPKPFLPASADELRAAGPALSQDELIERTLSADLYLSSLLAAAAVTTVVAAAFLVRADAWSGPVLAGTTALLILLRGRAVTGRAQRIWMLASGVAVAVLAAVVGTARLARSEPGWAVIVPAAAALATVVAVSVSGRAGRGVAPPTKRLADMLELLAAVAVLPLVLDVLDAYGRLHSLFG